MKTWIYVPLLIKMRYRLTSLGGLVMDTRGILDEDDRPQQPHYDTDVPDGDGDGNDDDNELEEGEILEEGEMVDDRGNGNNSGGEVVRGYVIADAFTHILFTNNFEKRPGTGKHAQRKMRRMANFNMKTTARRGKVFLFFTCIIIDGVCGRGCI
jgi:hypothetical protein